MLGLLLGRTRLSRALYAPTMGQIGLSVLYNDNIDGLFGRTCFSLYSNNNNAVTDKVVATATTQTTAEQAQMITTPSTIQKTFLYEIYKDNFFIYRQDKIDKCSATICLGLLTPIIPFFVDSYLGVLPSATAVLLISYQIYRMRVDERMYRLYLALGQLDGVVPNLADNTEFVKSLNVKANLAIACIVQKSALPLVFQPLVFFDLVKSLHEKNKELSK